MRRREKSPPGSDEGHKSGRDSIRSGENLADQWGLNDPQPGDEEIKTDLDGIRDDNPLTRMKIRTKGWPLQAGRWSATTGELFVGSRTWQKKREPRYKSWVPAGGYLESYQYYTSDQLQKVVDEYFEKTERELKKKLDDAAATMKAAQEAHSVNRKNLADQWGLNDPQPGDEEIKTDLDGIRDDNPLTRMKIRTKISTVTATPGEEERKRLLAERQRKSNERQWKADKKQHSKK
ncbi:unnamed protein product, partial [Mesorhabditis spiculigera]